VPFADPAAGPAWAEGHFDRLGERAADQGATFRFVPDRLTLFAVLRDAYQISNQTGSQAAADEAIDTVVDVARQRGWTLGPDETISHDDALAAIDQAGAVCAVKGVAVLPAVELPADP